MQDCGRQSSNATAQNSNGHHHTAWWDLKGWWYHWNANWHTLKRCAIQQPEMEREREERSKGGNVTRQPKSLIHKDTVTTIILMVKIDSKFCQTLVTAWSAASLFYTRTIVYTGAHLSSEWVRLVRRPSLTHHLLFNLLTHQLGRLHLG